MRVGIDGRTRDRQRVEGKGEGNRLERRGIAAVLAGGGRHRRGPISVEGEGLPCRVRRRRGGTRGGSRECARREPALARRNARRGMARATAPAEAPVRETLGTRTVDRRGLGSSEREGSRKEEKR